MDRINNFNALSATAQMVVEFGRTVDGWINIRERLDVDNRTLVEEVRRLRGIKEEVENKLRREERRGKKRARDVDNWLSDAKKKLEEEERPNAAESSGYISSMRRHGIVQNDITQVRDLIKRSRFTNLCIDVPYKGDKFNVPSFILNSARQKAKEIIECLSGDQIQIIGICGMKGAGKTTIAYLVNNELLDANNSFDHVFWVTMPQDHSIYELQNSIAEEVGLTLCTRETSRRAAELLEWLGSKKFVLIIDGICEIIALKEVGIPLDNIERKLLLTSEDTGVCRSMNCEEVKVEDLSPEESCKLFLEAIGPISEQDQNNAMSVAEMCIPVPLAIVEVAGRLKRMETSEWKNASDVLEGMGYMNKEFYKELKISYDRLKDKKLQECLLYCALFPQGFEIPRDELIAYWIVEELIHGPKNRQADFKCGKHIIKRLSDVCWLETAKHMDGRSFVKMKDAVRGMAIGFAKRHMVKAGMNLTDFPRQEEWLEHLYRVSLMYNDLVDCCFSPCCPELRTLLLQENEKLNRLSHSFFARFRSLYVLDLSGSSIEKLPETFINLEQLRLLILRKCKSLKRIPHLHNLKNLLHLDLSFTGLSGAPEGIGNLEKLVVLDFSGTRFKRPISGDFLQSLTHLRALRLGRCEEVLLESITRLEFLETLHMDFSDIRLFSSYFETQHWRSLKQYCIVCRMSTHRKRLIAPYVNRKTVILSFDTGWETVDPLTLPDNMQQLQIDRCSNVAGLLQRLQLGLFNGLRCLTFTKCPKLTHLFSSELDGSVLLLFGRLKVLQVYDCSKLKIILQCDDPCVSFPRRLVLSNLRELDSICSGTIKGIEEIEVVDCPKLNKIRFSTDGGWRPSKKYEDGEIGGACLSGIMLKKKNLWIKFSVKLHNKWCR